MVGRTLYSVPYRLIGKRLDARATAAMVEFYLDGQLVKTHAFQPRGRRTEWADLPEHRAGFFMRTPAWCASQAGLAGPACATLAGELLAVNALFRLRQAQGAPHPREPLALSPRQPDVPAFRYRRGEGSSLRVGLAGPSGAGSVVTNRCGRCRVGPGRDIVAPDPGDEGPERCAEDAQENGSDEDDSIRLSCPAVRPGPSRGRAARRRRPFGG